MGTYCSSVNYAISKEWSWDEMNLKLYILDMSLMFERKCKKSNEWTCPGVTYASELLVLLSFFTLYWFSPQLQTYSAKWCKLELLLTIISTWPVDLASVHSPKPKDFSISITEDKETGIYSWTSKSLLFLHTSFFFLTDCQNICINSRPFTQDLV